MTRFKAYVVWRGRKPGVYRTWDDCWEQVRSFRGAQYKGYPDWATADQAFLAKTNDLVPSAPAPRPAKTRTTAHVAQSYAVDGACSGNPGVMEYRGVHTETGAEIFHRGPYPLGTNNIAEFLAIVSGLQWCAERGCDWPIYSDSQIALGWVQKRQCRTNLPLEHNPLGAEIQAAERWLTTHTYPNPLWKWDTRNWGQIPADFGRK
ncbi:ribonuclease H-related protein [Gloeomargarita lithophora Alchichica-D10]|uniref:Ribonuclease H n=1 Tax=Gloeomargarita lithophora Alchichica-D10 TaxID=1188229 RepID=A0A1J0A937_9CYAN|nr:ribonuclease H family protein [Gloeomargarita lithophora]APB32437.1 ribonuclease H-related protein [Gloeomargarita lithophora Alchichica-D10]